MAKSDLKEKNIVKTEIKDKKEDVHSSGLLDYICKHAGNALGNADCYTFGEDVTISFEDCSGNDFLDLLKSVEDYGIDLENVQVHSDGDGWIAVDLIIG